MPIVTAAPLFVTDKQRASLERMARSTSLSPRKVTQARALLLAADGVATNEVARRCGTTNESLRAWRRRFESEGVDGVGRIAPGRGRKSWLPEGTVAEVVRVTREEMPDDTSTHWTTRSLAERFGIGNDPSLGSGGTTSSSRGGSRRSSCPTIRASRRSSSMSSGCM